MKTFDKKQTFIMKGVGICLMLVHHLFFDETYTANCSFVFDFSEKYLIIFAQLCKVCVALFVILSSFGLYKSYSKYIEKNGISVIGATKYSLLRIKKTLFEYWWAVIPFAIIGITTGMRTISDVYDTGTQSLVRILIDIFGLGGRFDMSHMYNITCWFLALIFGLYLLFPVLYALINKSFVLFCTVGLFFSFSSLPRLILTDKIYLLSFCIGMVLAKYDILDIIIKRLNNKLDIIGYVLFFIVAINMRYNHPITTDAIFAFSIIIVTLIITSKIPFIGTILEFLGKHSYNIFMTHTFFFSYYWKTIIYSPKHPIPVFLLLLAVTLIYSVFLEKTKKFCGNIFTKRMKKIKESEKTLIT